MAWATKPYALLPAQIRLDVRSKVRPRTVTHVLQTHIYIYKYNNNIYIIIIIIIYIKYKIIK